MSATERYYRDLASQDPRFVGIATVAALLDVHESTVRTWVNAGRFPEAYDLGKRRRWHLQEVWAFVHYQGRRGQTVDLDEWSRVREGFGFPPRTPVVPERRL